MFVFVCVCVWGGGGGSCRKGKNFIDIFFILDKIIHAK